MKLILKQYLSSLRERGELDAIIPDLLSQLGLNVFSRPGRGTRQDGVDVGAVGCLDGGPEKVYLFSIKSGNLSRSSWDGSALQSLRPSLNEILDSYIPHRLPFEHRERDVVICICVGGDVLEQVRPQLSGFITERKTDKISFEEWNGDKLASLIESCFLRDDLLPEHSRSHLRKSLAMLDEPEVSYKHFSELIKSLMAEVDSQSQEKRLMAIRQMSICLWILFAWAREQNMEAAYLSSEFTLLRGWKILSLCPVKKGNIPPAIETAFFSLFSAYQQICSEFLLINVVPHVGKSHALSSAVCPSCSLDVNLKLFDLLGRLATKGIWFYWSFCRYSDEERETKEKMQHEIQNIMASIKLLISNNPVLLLPAKDDQAIDIIVAAVFLALDERNYNFIKKWLAEMLGRASFAFETHGPYPCVLDSYSDLLSHPKKGDDEYRQSVTNGSILYPVIALFAALLCDEKTYNNIAHFKQNHLQHCNFQLWFPDESTEANIYTNDDNHGAVLSDVPVDRPKEEFLDQIFGECEQTNFFKELSVIKNGWWPLIFIACRHYRLPLPLNFLEYLKKN